MSVRMVASFMQNRFPRILVSVILLATWSAGVTAKEVVISDLFSVAPAARSIPRGAAPDGVVLNVNSTALANLDSGADTVRVQDFPTVDGKMESFVLHPFRVFAQGGDIIEIKSNGTTQAARLPEIATYTGQSLSNSSQTLVLTVSRSGDIHALISGDPTTSDTAIVPMGEHDGRHVMGEGKQYKGTFCADDEDMVAPGGNPYLVSNLVSRDSNPREVKLLLDASYNLYKGLGSDVDAVSDYMTNTIAAVSAIYQRDLQTYIVIKHLYVWETPDPMEADVSGDQLTKYRAYCTANRADVDRDTCHYVSMSYELGGVAYLFGMGQGVLGSKTFGYGVSNIHGNEHFPVDPTQFIWDIECIAHELGHNMGSPHTHCYSPPIDCCYIQEACTECTAVVPQVGTIMSYCHLLGAAGGIDMTFHPRCIAVMRPYIEGVAAAYTAQPDIRVYGGSHPDAILEGNTAGGREGGSDFGIVPVGGSSAVRQYAIYNAGDQPLNLTGTSPVTFSGHPRFQVVQPTVSSIAPAQAALFSVILNTSTVGTYSGTIHIASNDPDTGDFSFAIKGSVQILGGPEDFQFMGSVDLPDIYTTGVDVTIPVSGVSGPIARVSLLIGGDNCNSNNPSTVGIDSQWVGDLAMTLQSPTGTVCDVMNRPGRSGDAYYGAEGPNFCGTLLKDDATTSIQAIEQFGGPYIGEYKPMQAFLLFNGEDANGTWTVHLSTIAHPATIHSLTLTIVPAAAPASVVPDWTLFR